MWRVAGQLIDLIVLLSVYLLYVPGVWASAGPWDLQRICNRQLPHKWFQGMCRCKAVRGAGTARFGDSACGSATGDSSGDQGRHFHQCQCHCYRCLCACVTDRLHWGMLPVGIEPRVLVDVCSAGCLLVGVLWGGTLRGRTPLLCSDNLRLPSRLWW